MSMSVGLFVQSTRIAQNDRKRTSPIFTSRRYASVVYACVCLSVCHTPVSKWLNIASRK